MRHFEDVVVNMSSMGNAIVEICDVIVSYEDRSETPYFLFVFPVIFSN